jgi:hypothetical protein
MKFVATCVSLLLGGRLVLGQTPGASPKPDLCDVDTGKWDPYHINCDFDCDANGWEVKCVCDDKSQSCDVITCVVDADGAPDSEDITFSCRNAGEGQSPSCDLDPLLNSAVATSCVKNTISQVLQLWQIGVSD